MASPAGWFPISSDTFVLGVFAAGLAIGAALTWLVIWCVARGGA